MFSLRSVALLFALSTTVYSASAHKVINKCNFDVNAISSESHDTITIKAGGGTSPVLENNANNPTSFMLFRDSLDNQLKSETQLELAPSINKLVYDMFIKGSSPIDGHFSLTPSDGSCPSISSDQNLAPGSPDESGQCDTSASVTLTLRD